MTPDPLFPSPPDEPDFAAFRAWLERRGCSHRTATTTASQVRRVLREAGPVVSRTNLLLWHEAQEPQIRTPITSSWRRYREWWESQGVSGLPDFPRRSAPKTGVPPEVVAAIHDLQAAGVALPAMASLRWSPLDPDSALHSALVATAPGLATGSLQALLSETGIVLLPAAPLRTVLEWGHPHGQPGQPAPGAPVLPSAPGEAQPMPLTRLRRIMRKGAR